MFDLSDFKADETAQEKGVWIDFGGGARFKLASLSSKLFQKDFQARIAPYKNVGRDIPEDEQEQVMIDCLSKHIVLDWEGVFDGEKPFKYSKDNCKKLLNEIPKVRDMIINEAQKLQNFKAKTLEATAGK